MDIAKLLLAYIEVLIWPAVLVLVVSQFSKELKQFFAKILRSHEVEVDVLGQRIKLKALEKLTEKTNPDEMVITGQHHPYDNSLLTVHLLSLISNFSNDEILILRNMAQKNTANGYVGCEADRLILEDLVIQNILIRDDKGFYYPTDDGNRILLALKNL